METRVSTKQLNPKETANIIQKVIEKYYLEPIDNPYKENLKDGYIERNIHGAMHSARATLWCLIMNNLLQDITPEYVNNSVKKIADYLHTDTGNVLFLTLITTACHDAARKGEGKDWWENESGEISAKILKELELTELEAKIFAKAIAYKDNREEYFTILKDCGIQEKDCNAFDYIRKLVNLGDNLDLMRCSDKFGSEYIFKTLATIDGFNITLHHDKIMQFIFAIHQFIYDQYDMRFGCAIQNTKKEIVAKLPCRLSNKEKIKYEHAENTFAVIFHEALCNPLFKPYLQNFIISKADKFVGEPAFDPLIHGTNASIFSILPKAEFNIMPTLQMMDDYQVAPMSGELTRGGYRVVGTELIKKEGIGQTSFTRMTQTNYNSYSLDKVLSDYTTIKVSDTCKIDLNEAISYGVNHAFTNINLILIYLTRARQMHESLEQVISSLELQALQIQLAATIQFFYFVQLLGTHIHPDYAAIEKFVKSLAEKNPNNTHASSTVSDVARKILTFDYFLKKIIENKIDMKNILDNPTEENLRKALAILEFPQKCQFEPFGSYQEIEVDFPTTQFFCLEKKYSKTIEPYMMRYRVDEAIYCLSRNCGPEFCGIGASIDNILSRFLAEELPYEFMQKLGKESQHHLTILDDRIRLFKKLIETPQEKFTLQDDQKYFLKHPFPIVLTSEAEEKIPLYDHFHDEYRSMASLKLGEDIKIIATDIHAHRLEIIKFLLLHQINNIQVILFSDLKDCRKSKKRPAITDISIFQPKIADPILSNDTAKQAKIA